MSSENSIKALRDLINTAQSAINSAKKILTSLEGTDSDDDLSFDTSGLSEYTSEDDHIVE